METFKSVFGDGGNTAEINLEWGCEKCGEPLIFRLIVDDDLDIEWKADCCNETYIVTPYIAAYNKKKYPKIDPTGYIE